MLVLKQPLRGHRQLLFQLRKNTKHTWPAFVLKNTLPCHQITICFLIPIYEAPWAPLNPWAPLGLPELPWASPWASLGAQDQKKKSCGGREVYHCELQCFWSLIPQKHCNLQCFEHAKHEYPDYLFFDPELPGRPRRSQGAP